MRLFTIVLLFLLTSENCYANRYKLHPGVYSFQGEKFEIELKVPCPGVNLACQNVTYDGINKKTGGKIHLKGQLMVNPQANRQWYEFENGQYLYLLTPDYTPSDTPDEKWRLNVSIKGKYIISDYGVMY